MYHRVVSWFFVYFQSTQDGVYGAVCEYAIICQSEPGVTMPFPPCSQTTWGVRDTAARYGLEPLQRGAVFQTTDGGQAEVRLRTSGDRRLRFSTKLKAYGGKDGCVRRTIEGAVIHRIIGDIAVFSFWFVSTQSISFPLISHTELYSP